MPGIEKELNEAQLKAVTTLEGPVLIIAGAGSGKTRVITYRIARMLEKGINQSAILALTFTNKAAREMESRVKEITGKKLQNLTISTFHAFGVKILRAEIEILGYRKNFSIYDTTDKLELIKESLRECKLYGEKTDLKKIEQIFSNVKIGRFKWGRAGGGISGGRAGAGGSAVGGVGGGSAGSAIAGGNFVADNIWKPAYEAYQKNLKIYNALDFDDLLTIPISLFEGYPDILEKYRKRYRYILVDEFQDTSLIQYELLRTLAKNESGKSNVCVVGDDDQSIYSWRGANYGNLLLFEKDFPNPLEIKLEQNYRSTTTILEAANGVISHNTSRKEKNLWSGKGEGRPIEFHVMENESEEAAFIARTIKKLRFAEQRNYGDFGVLVRTNSQFDCLEEAFLAENIPCKVSGGLSFFDRKEIRDILSYLRVIANHHDDVNLLRIINTPRRGIGKAGIQGAAEFAKKNNTSLFDAFNRMAAAGSSTGSRAKNQTINQATGEFLELLESLREDLFGPGDLHKKVRSFVDRIDYWSYLVSEHSKDEKKARWKYSNIEYLINMIEDWEKDPDNLERGLYAYLNRISLLTRSDGEDEGRGGTGRGKANLMTIHAAKGLEFPVVFIAGAEDGIIPHERSLEEESEEDSASKPLEEERRLFYVAITRARDKLCISCCKQRRRHQSFVERSPSPFLAEIPPGLVEWEGAEEKEDPDETRAMIARFMERSS